MKVSDLKAILDIFPYDQEITVSIAASVNDNNPTLTYDIGYGENEFIRRTRAASQSFLAVTKNAALGLQKCSTRAPSMHGPLAVGLWKSFRFAPPFPQSNRLYYYENPVCPAFHGVGLLLHFFEPLCCTFYLTNTPCETGKNVV